MARPRPDAPPVTIAICSSRRMALLLPPDSAPTRGRAQPGVWVAGPAPAELRPAFADPQRRDPAIAAARAQQREAVAPPDDFGVVCGQRDPLGHRERRAAVAC